MSASSSIRRVRRDREMETAQEERIQKRDSRGGWGGWGGVVVGDGGSAGWGEARGLVYNTISIDLPIRTKSFRVLLNTTFPDRVFRMLLSFNDVGNTIRVFPWCFI